MINLLSPQIKDERTYGRRNRALLGYAVILVITATATAAIMVASLRFLSTDESKLQSEIDDFTTEITVLESAVKPIESVAQRLDTAKKIDDLSVQFSSLIPEIGAVLPNGVVLNALSLSGGATAPLQLDVDLQSADLAPVLIRNLVESDLFEAADISSLSPIGTSANSSYSFNASLTASFTGASNAQTGSQ